MKPEPGWAAECDVVRVLDDAIEVEITKRIRVHLLDCCPKDQMDMIKRECLGAKCLVHIPGSVDITFDSVLGYVYPPGSDITINQLLVEMGLCTKEKP